MNFEDITGALEGLTEAQLMAVATNFDYLSEMLIVGLASEVAAAVNQLDRNDPLISDEYKAGYLAAVKAVVGAFAPYMPSWVESRVVDSEGADEAENVVEE